MEWLTTTTVLRDLRDFENRAAWEQFHARFHRPIVGFARSLGLGAADAEDVAQETLLAFAELYRRGQYDRGKGRLSRWLFGIAYRQALAARRGATRRGAKLAVEASEPSFWTNLPDDAATTQMWEREWEQSLLEQCLDQVRREVEPVTFQAFELVVRADRDPADAARELNVPIKAVYNAKHRVLKRVRELRAALEEVE